MLVDFSLVHVCFCAESIFAPLPRTKRGMPLVLHGDPKGKNFLYTVGHGVIIRDIEVLPLIDSSVCNVDVHTE